MKIFLIALPCLFCSWFYRGQTPNTRGQSPFKWGQSPQENRPKLSEWPSTMPIFGQIMDNSLATVRRDGNSSFVGFIDPAPPANVLDRATSAFVSNGWALAPISTSDMVLFTRGESVAAVLVENHENGSRVTAIQRLAK